jgi:hypothetical protein
MGAGAGRVAQSGEDPGDTLERHQVIAPVAGVRRLDRRNSDTRVTVTPWTVYAKWPPSCQCVDAKPSLKEDAGGGKRWVDEKRKYKKPT